MTHELRFRGQLLSEHASEKEAKAAIPKKAEHIADHKAHVAEYSVGERKPFRIYCRGNLVDTADSHEDAEEYVKKAYDQVLASNVGEVEPMETVWRIYDERDGEIPPWPEEKPPELPTEPVWIGQPAPKP